MKDGTRAGIALLAIATFLLLAIGTVSLPVYKLREPPQYTRHIRLNADIQAIKSQLQQYKAMNGFYPTTEQGLQALVIQPSTEPGPSRWRQFFKEAPRDPWDSPYVYRCPGIKHPDKYDLYSAGPNRVDDNGAGDDDWGE
jgi:general secretion pathway protein G